MRVKEAIHKLMQCDPEAILEESAGDEVIAIAFSEEGYKRVSSLVDETEVEYIGPSWTVVK